MILTFDKMRLCSYYLECVCFFEEVDGFIYTIIQGINTNTRKVDNRGEARLVLISSKCVLVGARLSINKSHHTCWALAHLEDKGPRPIM